MPQSGQDILTLREAALQYLNALLIQGIPYLWGGDDPLAGFDCSGMIHEIHQAIGLEPHNVDSTAHDLYLKYKIQKTEDPQPGDLVFWFKDGKAIHVEMIWILTTAGPITVGASGGGSKTKTLQDAIKNNAFIKPRPITYRGINYKIVDPFKEYENAP